jgi:predicted transcriptional regulator
VNKFSITFPSNPIQNGQDWYVDHVKENFKIVRLAEGDVRFRTDHIMKFRELILANERMYPSIEQWYLKKVLPGIRYSERVAFVGYLDEKPVVSAVVKKGELAKFCHLKIAEQLQGSHLGDVFFSLMALEIRDVAKAINFTLPETLWQTKGPFFHSFGFGSAALAETQYRLFDRELQCRASFPAVWQATLEKIPRLADLYSFGGFSTDTQLLFSVRPKFADRILSRKKTVELRRKFSSRWMGCRLNLYASAPVMSLVGEARIAGIAVNTPEVIWEKFHQKLGCTRAEFEEYSAGAEELYAIQLEDIRPYTDRFPLTHMSSLVKEDLTPPQSYFSLEKNRPWAKAISLAAYLHGCFKSTLSFALEFASNRQRRTKNPFADPRPKQKEFRTARTGSNLHLSL